jgi:cyclic pyranopterin phosphate synthase
MMDGFGRVARKLRISITDRCNMHCMYCMPYNNTEWFEQDNLLSYEEIFNLANIFAGLGIKKIRVTGGEPTIRPKMEDLISSLSKIRGIESVSMTTNGLLLREKAKQLKEAGLTSVNISLDTFRADRFKSMSGIDGLNQVLASIQTADDAGLKLKINTVVVRGWNDDEVLDFARFARSMGYTVRFIEFMPLDGSGIWRSNLVVSKREIIERINQNIQELVPLKNDISEPAMLYSFLDGKGTIGFIPSITEPFCQYCDRIRITSEGMFMTCLFANTGYDLKILLRSKKSQDEIKRYILECIKKKPEGVVSMIRSNALRPSLNLMHRIGG